MSELVLNLLSHFFVNLAGLVLEFFAGKDEHTQSEMHEKVAGWPQFSLLHYVDQSGSNQTLNILDSLPVGISDEGQTCEMGKIWFFKVFHTDNKDLDHFISASNLRMSHIIGVNLIESMFSDPSPSRC
jgi:hypothetical protein